MTVSQRSIVVNKSPFDISIVFYIISQRKQNMNLFQYIYSLFSFDLVSVMYAFSVFITFGWVSCMQTFVHIHLNYYHLKIYLFIAPNKNYKWYRHKLPCSLLKKTINSLYIQQNTVGCTWYTFVFGLLDFFFKSKGEVVILFTTLLPQVIHRKLLLHRKRRNKFLELLRWML